MTDNSYWKGRSLSRVCECHLCEAGLASHADESHDQNLYPTVEVPARNGSRFHIELFGGSTKCGRYMAEYFASLAENQFEGKRILELGGGTGIVGICASLLGGDVMITDQAPVLDILRFNVKANLPKDKAQSVRVEEFFWGNSEQLEKVLQDGDWDMVVGADLVYAKESIPGLITTLELLTRSAVKPIPVYLAMIRRFDWEQGFFQQMSGRFSHSRLYAREDIAIYRFVRKEYRI